MTPIYKFFASCIVCIACSSSAARSQHPPNAPHDPTAALLVTSDITNFWRAYDRARVASTNDDRYRAYLDGYIRPGSAGLHDWVVSRLSSGHGLVTLLVSKGWSMDRLMKANEVPLTDAERAKLTRDTLGMGDMLAAMNLDEAVQRRPRFFAAIRRNTLAIDTAGAIKDSIRTHYQRLSALYPDAVFPPVYFLIGQLSSGGTTGESGQLIGAELHGTDATTPLDELSPWERGVVGTVSGLPGLVAHELMHIQQAHARGGAPLPGKPTLLALALEEGCATSLAWTVTGRDPAQVANQYGLAHEHELWVEFRREMNGTDASNWLYQGDRSKDRPADLGYFVGARICGSYYRNAADKGQAIRDIFRMEDPAAFLVHSGYAP